MSVQLLVFVNFEPFRILDLARLAVVVAIFPIDRRVHSGEDEGGCFGNGVRGGAGGQEGFALLKDRGKRHLTSGGVVHGPLGTDKSRHIGKGSRGTGNCRLPLGGIRKHEKAIFFIYIRSVLLRRLSAFSPYTAWLADVVFCLIGLIRWRFWGPNTYQMAPKSSISRAGVGLRYLKPNRCISDQYLHMRKVRASSS